METQLKALLEKKIQEFIDLNCESDFWPGVCIYPGLTRDMATAAEVVFDACCRGQDFAATEDI